MSKHTINIILLIALTGLSVFFFWGQPYLGILLAVIFIVYLLILSFGILFLKFQYFLPAVNRLSDKRILLTFDDGPDPLTTPRILDTLRDHHLTAIFFVIGEKAEKHPELLQRIAAEGHVIGNHTYHHSNFFSLQLQSTVESELRRCDETVKGIAGVDTLYFRPPIGYTNPRIARVVRKLGKQTVGWRLRSYDSVLKEPGKLLERLNTHVRPGDIVLLHDNLPQTAEVLGQFITQARQNGIIFADSKDIFAH